MNVTAINQKLAKLTKRERNAGILKTDFVEKVVIALSRTLLTCVGLSSLLENVVTAMRVKEGIPYKFALNSSMECVEPV